MTWSLRMLRLAELGSSSPQSWKVLPWAPCTFLAPSLHVPCNAWHLQCLQWDRAPGRHPHEATISRSLRRCGFRSCRPELALWNILQVNSFEESRAANPMEYHAQKLLMKHCDTCLHILFLHILFILQTADASQSAKLELQSKERQIRSNTSHIRLS